LSGANTTRAIIVAAGMGRRLAPYTDDRPKCLVEVNGRSILERQVEAYRMAGVDDICVVRGYLADRIALPGLRYYENPSYRENNILASLFHAEEAMAPGFFFSYSDIVFRPEVVRALVAAPGDYALVVDRLWADAYEGRDLHPISEAELAHVEAGQVRAVGKRVVPRERAHGEFIGLARFSARAASRMRDEYHRLDRALGPEAPFRDAPRFRSAYLTHLLNHLIEAGEEMRSVDIDGGWREIDTTQDLERARALVDW
jgi:phosphoenolpyruvate phosphomutase